MYLQIDYLEKSNKAKITCDLPNDPKWKLLCRIISDSYDDVIVHSNAVSLFWRVFLGFRNNLSLFSISHNISIKISDKAKQYLEQAKNVSYSSLKLIKPLCFEEINNLLKINGFLRELTNNQMENIYKIAPLPSGATFSVPGAGKTTEALAFYYINKLESDKLLVVAPKNAFSTWEEELNACVPREEKSFVRLRGGENNIKLLLLSKPKFMLITYQQLPRVLKLISSFLAQNKVFMFLDESHRIKSGKQGITAEAILRISYLPIRKLILSGTPMPQDIRDLEPQLSYLYPDINTQNKDIVQLFKPIYVRTTKEQLGLPQVERRLITLEMGQLQSKIYRLLKSEVARQLNFKIEDLSKYSLRKLGKCTMKLMQFVSNPALLATDMNYVFNQDIGKLLLSNQGPKIEYACKRARELANENKKVIIWSMFVENVELINERLKDLGSDYIHGGVDTGEEDEKDTREAKIKRFHEDKNAMVLVANPAAASEGISLHKVCQHAIYIDRSFNAAHYLQSEDRIHRLGLKENEHPIIEILECPETIDEVIRRRLNIKIDRMALALNDSSLSIDPIPYDFEMFEDDNNNGITNDDISDIIEHFFSVKDYD